MSARVDPAKFCRVAADTRRHLEEQAQNEQFADKFSAWNDEHMKAICGDRLMKPIRGFLFILAQIRDTERSFGMVEQGKCKAFDALRHELDALEQACQDAYKDL